MAPKCRQASCLGLLPRNELLLPAEAKATLRRQRLHRYYATLLNHLTVQAQVNLILSPEKRRQHVINLVMLPTRTYIFSKTVADTPALVTLLSEKYPFDRLPSFITSCPGGCLLYWIEQMQEFIDKCQRALEQLKQGVKLSPEAIAELQVVYGTTGPLERELTVRQYLEKLSTVPVGQTLAIAKQVIKALPVGIHFCHEQMTFSFNIGVGVAPVLMSLSKYELNKLFDFITLDLKLEEVEQCPRFAYVKEFLNVNTPSIIASSLPSSPEIVAYVNIGIDEPLEPDSPLLRSVKAHLRELANRAKVQRSVKPIRGLVIAWAILEVAKRCLLDAEMEAWIVDCYEVVESAFEGGGEVEEEAEGALAEEEEVVEPPMNDVLAKLLKEEAEQKERRKIEKAQAKKAKRAEAKKERSTKKVQVVNSGEQQKEENSDDEIESEDIIIAELVKSKMVKTKVVQVVQPEKKKAPGKIPPKKPKLNQATSSTKDVPKAFKGPQDLKRFPVSPIPQSSSSSFKRIESSKVANVVASDNCKRQSGKETPVGAGVQLQSLPKCRTTPLMKPAAVEAPKGQPRPSPPPLIPKVSPPPPIVVPKNSNKEEKPDEEPLTLKRYLLGSSRVHNALVEAIARQNYTAKWVESVTALPSSGSGDHLGTLQPKADDDDPWMRIAPPPNPFKNGFRSAAFANFDKDRYPLTQILFKYEYASTQNWTLREFEPAVNFLADTMLSISVFDEEKRCYIEHLRHLLIQRYLFGRQSKKLPKINVRKGYIDKSILQAAHLAGLVELVHLRLGRNVFTMIIEPGLVKVIHYEK